jgi:prepilin signal peptidase PulO-like enzyme (type II secretory pathway)
MSAIDIAFGIALLAILTAVTVVDFRTLLIPDELNIALTGLGLVYQSVVMKSLPVAAIAFSVMMFASFWLIRSGYQRFRGTAGLGLGDVKMAGGSAMWFSPWNLPIFLLAACFSALIFVVWSSLRSGGLDRAAKIPFGPFLGVGLAVTWIIERSEITTFIPNGWH